MFLPRDLQIDRYEAMRLPDLRTNYGKVRGFFSLVDRGKQKAPGLARRGLKNDKSSSFTRRVVLRSGKNGRSRHGVRVSQGPRHKTPVFISYCPFEPVFGQVQSGL